MKQPGILIIFARNLVYGQVKTRLAASAGADAAFEVYKKLLQHTNAITQNILAAKIVYYSEHVETGDLWNNTFMKATQKGDDLGERMFNAFEEMFERGYSKAVMIGTDCPYLDEKTINDAFQRLNESDVVIGPAYDGGYYLLGIKKLRRCLFENVEWSTRTVFEKTVGACTANELSYFLLPVLHDVDEETDLVHLEKHVYE